MGAFYAGTFSGPMNALGLPIEFPRFAFRCSHTDWTDKLGEHAHMVSEAILGSRYASASFWNVARGTFEKGAYYLLQIEYGIREVDPEVLAALIAGNRVKLPPVEGTPVVQKAPELFSVATTQVF